MEKTLLSEIIQYSPTHKNKYACLESEASNVIVSAINLLNYINENFDKQESAELTKRFYEALRHSDYTKFERKVQILDEKNGNKNDKK